MALAKTHTTSERGGVGTGTATVSVSTDGETQREVLLPPGTVDKEIDGDFVYTALKSWFSGVTGLDDGVTITIKTNSASVAIGDTLTFMTPGSIHYAVDTNGANLNGKTAPFTVSVTRFFASNPSTTQSATLRLSWQIDSTP